MFYLLLTNQHRCVAEFPQFFNHLNCSFIFSFQLLCLSHYSVRNHHITCQCASVSIIFFIRNCSVFHSIITHLHTLVSDLLFLSKHTNQICPNTYAIVFFFFIWKCVLCTFWTCLEEFNLYWHVLTTFLHFNSSVFCCIYLWKGCPVSCETDNFMSICQYVICLFHCFCPFNVWPPHHLKVIENYTLIPPTSQSNHMIYTWKAMNIRFWVLSFVVSFKNIYI